MSSLRMRQICLVARSLSPVVEEIRSVLGLEVCHRDPGVGKFGLENALWFAHSIILSTRRPRICFARRRNGQV